MKRSLSFLLAVCILIPLALSLVGCTGGETETPVTIDDAVNALEERYSADNGKPTSKSYSLINKIELGGLSFDLTWSVDHPDISITSESKRNYVVNIPKYNVTEAFYTLTATITDAAGNKRTVEFTRIFPYLGEPPEPPVTLDDALLHLSTLYAEDENKITDKDYSLIARITIKDASFEVTYAVNHEKLNITLDKNKENYTVKLPDYNRREAIYTVTATITDSEGNTASHTMTRTLPEYKHELEGVGAGVAVGNTYKLILDNKSDRSPLFATSAIKGGALECTLYPKVATNLYVEEGLTGYKIYYVMGGVKNYLYADITLDDSAEDGFTSVLTFSAESFSEFAYDGTLGVFYTTLYIPELGGADGNVSFVLGAVGQSESISLLLKSEFTEDGVGNTHFPADFIQRATAEKYEPDDPSVLTTFDKLTEIGEAMESGSYTTDPYRTKGTITEITNSSLGHLYITDEDGNRIFVEGVYSENGELTFDKLTSSPSVGDIVTLYALVGNREGEAVLKDAYLISIIKEEQTVVYEAKNLEVGEVGVSDSLTLPTKGSLYENVSISWELISDIPSHVTFKNGMIYVTEPSTREAFITFNVSFSSGAHKRIIEVAVRIAPIPSTSISDAIDIAAGMPENIESSESYVIEGVITEIINPTYGHVYLSDKEGNSIYVYGIYSEDGLTPYYDLSYKPTIGDTVKLIGPIGLYGGAPQLRRASIISVEPKTWTNLEKLDHELANLGIDKVYPFVTLSLPTSGVFHKDVIMSWELVATDLDLRFADNALTVFFIPTEEAFVTLKLRLMVASVEKTVEVALPIDMTPVISVGEALLIASEQNNGTYTKDKYFVEGTVTEIVSSAYGNMYITDGNGNLIYIYSLYSRDGELMYKDLDVKPEVGNKVVVFGVIGTLGGESQIKNAWLTEITANEPEEPTPEEPAPEEPTPEEQ